MIYFRLCKSGFVRSILEAKELTAREVLQAIYYDNFCADYERAFMEINKE